MLKTFLYIFAALSVAGCGSRGARTAPAETGDHTSVQAVEAAESASDFQAPVDEDPLSPAPEEPSVPSPSAKGTDAGMEALSKTVSSPSVATVPDNNGGKIVVEGTAEFDKTVHDFGDILLSDGPVTCSFTIKNVGKDPIAIYEVVSSCGCTVAEWTREPLVSGKSGKITATFDNTDGPIPFDKNLTVYISGIKKPVILKLRGYAHEREYTLEELFGEYRIGPLGFKDKEIKVGNMEQGTSRSEQVQIANLGTRSADVRFEDVSKNLTLSVSPNPIPAGSKAVLTATVNSDRELWGKNWYTAVPVVNGTRQGGKVAVWAFTKENFNSLSNDERASGSQPMFASSNANFGTVSKGAVVEVEFSLTNKGKADFVCYKADCDSEGVAFGRIPTLKSGEGGSFTVTVDTVRLPKGENTLFITLTTNSPLRPIVNLFVVGTVK